MLGGLHIGGEPLAAEDGFVAGTPGPIAASAPPAPTTPAQVPAPAAPPDARPAVTDCASSASGHPPSGRPTLVFGVSPEVAPSWATVVRRHGRLWRLA